MATESRDTPNRWQRTVRKIKVKVKVKVKVDEMLWAWHTR
jgi:hypothetical protein